MILDRDYGTAEKISKLDKAIEAQEQIRLLKKLREVKKHDLQLFGSCFLTEKNRDQIKRLNKRIALVTEGYNRIILEL